MKKIHLWLLCLMLVLPLAAFAGTMQGYQTRPLAEGGVMITAYTETSEDLVLPDTLDGKPVTGLAEELFAYRGDIKTIILPDSLITMEPNPFLGCTAALLVSPTHPHYAVVEGVLFDKGTQTLVAYPAHAEATHYQVPEGTEHIAEKAFYGATNLQSITLPDSLLTLGVEAFNECAGLTAVTIPEKVNEIPLMAFHGCMGLAEVQLPSGLKTIDAWAFAKSGLKDVVLPEGLTTVGDWAFLRCTQLSGITLPASLTQLSESAFDALSEDALFTVPKDSYADIWVQASDYNYQYPDM